MTGPAFSGRTLHMTAGEARDNRPDQPRRPARPPGATQKMKGMSILVARL
jgi:hypothetical protein